MVKKINMQIQHKRGTEADWNASNYIALEGELIIYKPDSTYTKPRFKVGDGVTKVNELPFTDIFGFENGDGENSIQYSGSNSLSDFSFAFGEGAVAGCRGYYFTNIDLENKIIYIDNYPKIWPEYYFSTEEQKSTPRLLKRDEQISYRDPGGYDMLTITDNWYGINDFESGYEVGDRFSICNGGHYDLIATISNIDGNRIYYDGSLIFTSIAEGEENEPDGYSFFVPDKPTIGSRQLGFKALSIGSNYATGSYSVALGTANKAHGDYSFIAGGGNLGIYGTAVFGMNNEARQKYSFITGLGNRTYALHSSLLGRGLRNTNEDATVVGKYNDEAETDLLFTVGNGTSFDTKANALTVHKDGMVKASKMFTTPTANITNLTVNSLSASWIPQTRTANITNGNNNKYNSSKTNYYIGGKDSTCYVEGSMVHGLGLTANGATYATTVGRYNDNSVSGIFQVGIGTDANNRKNGLNVDSQGNLTVAGTITDGQGNILGAGGGSISVDTEMSDTSENAVQNKVVKQYVDNAVSSMPEIYVSETAPTGAKVGAIWIDTSSVSVTSAE